mmetsp:Transcript_28037/g.71455  ORF Transcript_28037/g.71455 Transcript_28037/m.71455 type:complete len:480 (+) Transcript_28037:805-2244(+)
MQADDVHAQDLARVLAVQQLGHALALLLRQRLGVGLERGLGHAQREALLLGHLLRLLLRHAHKRHLWVREAGRGDGQVVEHVRAAAHVLHRADALGGRGVRQHVLAVGVADAVHVGHHLAGLVQHLHLVGHGDEAAAVGLRADGAQVQALREGRAAGGHHHRVHLQRVNHLLGLEVGQLHQHGLHAGHAGRDLGGNDAGVVVDGAAVDEQALRDARNLAVKARHQDVHGLDKGHLGAQRGVHVGELEPDVARADDGHPVRQPLELERVVGREHGLAVNGDAGGHEGHRAGGDDDVARGHLAAHVHAARHAVLDLVRAHKLGRPHQDVHAQRLQRALQVALHRGGQVLGVVRDALAVKADRAHLHAHGLEVLRVLELAHAAGRGQQRLGGHAAAVDARAANVVPLNHRHLEPLLHGVQGSTVATHTAADDDEVVIILLVCSLSHHSGPQGTRAHGAHQPLLRRQRWHAVLHRSHVVGKHS